MYFIISSDKVNLKFLNLLMNSKLLNFFYIMDNPQEGKTFAEIKPSVIKDLPIKNISENEQTPFIQKADLMLELNKKLQITKQNFYNELKLEKLTTKLQKFEELEFDDFIKEYTKAKKISFANGLEKREFKNYWEPLFENDKREVLALQNQINIKDKEIDEMVYKLYDLSFDEINIIEGNQLKTKESKMIDIINEKKAKYFPDDDAFPRYYSTSEVLQDINSGTINQENAQTIYEKIYRLGSRIDFSAMDIRHKIIELAMSQSGDYRNIEEAEKLEIEFNNTRECAELLEKMADIIKKNFPKVLKPKNILK